MLRTNKTGAVVAAAMLVAAVIGFAGIAPYLLAGGDNAGYIAEAESLLQSGQRLNLYEAGTPSAELKPALFPVMLAGVEWLFGRNIAAMKALLVLFAVAAVAAAWWTVRVGLEECRTPDGEDPSWHAALIALWFALAPSLTLYCHDVLSDVPFAALAILAIGLTGRAAAPKASRWLPAAAAGVLIVATQLRAAGLILMGACAGYLVLMALVRRKQAGHAPRVAGAVLLCVLTLAVFAYLLQGERNYFTPEQLRRGLDTAGGTGSIPAEGLAKRVVRMGRFYATFLPSEVTLYDGFGPEYAVYAVALLGGITCLVGLVTLLRRGGYLIPAVWFLHQLAFLFWPFADARFYLPTFPLYLCLLWVGARRLFAWAAACGRICSFAAAFVFALAPAVSILGTLFLAGAEETESITVVEWGAGAVLLAGAFAWLCFGTEAAPASDEQRSPAPADMAMAVAVVVLLLGAGRCVCENVIRERRRGPVPTEEGWHGFYEASLWLKEHAKPTDIVLSAKIPLVWFWTGLRGVHVPKRGGADAANRALSTADWFILDDLHEDRAAPRFAEMYLTHRLDGWERRWSRRGTSVWKRKTGEGEPDSSASHSLPSGAKGESGR